jgi:hypothetical protein
VLQPLAKIARTGDIAGAMSREIDARSRDIAAKITG